MQNKIVSPPPPHLLQNPGSSPVCYIHGYTALPYFFELVANDLAGIIYIRPLMHEIISILHLCHKSLLHFDIMLVTVGNHK